MNKADLVAAMAEKAGVSKKDAEASMRYFLGFYVLLSFLKPYFELNKEVNVER